jgi:CBS domain-containing protein
MNISDLMHRNVELIKEDATIREAARRMKEAGIGVLPVVDDSRVLGMITDRDIVVRSIAHGDDPDKTRVSQAMTVDVEWCYDDHDIEIATRKMGDRQIQRLLVLDRQEKLVGIISLGDLASAREHVVQTLEAIKAPTKASAAGNAEQAARH